MPISTAMSPPGRTWWYCVLIRVSLPGQHLDRALRVGEEFQPLLPHGVEGDDLHAALGRLLQRVQEAGQFEPVFWPKKNIASQFWRSSNTTVPTLAPMTFLSATEVVSWHMFELSGRLLLP